MGTIATNAEWQDRDIRQGPRPLDAKPDHEAKAGKIFKKLDLSGLESWPLELTDSGQTLLAE